MCITRVLFISLAILLPAGMAFAHSDKNENTNSVRMPGVTVADNGSEAGFGASNAILNSDRTASPQQDEVCWISSSKKDANDLAAITITFPKPVKFDRVAFNTPSMNGNWWYTDEGYAHHWWVEVDGVPVADKDMDRGGASGFYLHDPYGDTPNGDSMQHEVIGFYPVRGTQLKLKFRPISRGSNTWQWAVRDVNVWLSDNIDIGCSGYDDTFYMPMHGVGSLYSGEYIDFMGPGGPNAAKGMAIGCWYMDETYGSGKDYAFDSQKLRHNLQQITNLNVPTFINLNGGPWLLGKSETSIWHKFVGDTDVKSPTTNLMFNSNNVAATNSGNDAYVGGYYLTLARGASGSDTGTTYRAYKKRNIQAAAGEILNWARTHSELFVGVTIDSELIIPPDYDYNPNMIAQFRKYEESLCGGDIALFNSKCRTNLASWSVVEPPRNGCNTPYWNEWIRFREVVVNQMVDDTVQWLVEAGIPRKRIFTHQCGFEGAHEATMPWTGSVTDSHLGMTAYDATAASARSLNTFRHLDRAWGFMEYNAKTPDDYNNTLNCLENAWNYGAHVIMPWQWCETPGWPVCQIRNTKSAAAYRDFMNEIIGHPYGSYLWHFNPSGDAEGWTNYSGMDKQSCADSLWSATITSSDPWIMGPGGMSFGYADNNQTANFRMRIDSGDSTTGQICWITDSDLVWDEKKRVDFPAKADGNWHTYSVSLADTMRETGRINRIKIVPAKSAGMIGKRVDLDWVSITPGNPTWDFLPSGDAEGLSVWNDMSAASCADGLWSAKITGSNPYFGTLAGLGYVASDVDRILIRMKISGGGAGKGTIRWTTTANARWGDYSQQFAVRGDDKWWVYEIPVGINGGWYGTIDQIRIDPTDNGIPFIGQSVQIDWIKIARPRFVPDTIAPTGSITINSGAASTDSSSVTLTLSTADVGTGTSQMRLSNDGINWSSWESYTDKKLWNLAPKNGVKRVFAQFRDYPGNTSPTYSSSINLQTH